MKKFEEEEATESREADQLGEVTAPGLQQEKIVKRPKCPHQPWQNRFDPWL